MEGLARKEYKIARQTKEDVELCREIYEWSSKKLNYPRLLSMIRTTGLQAVRELYLETKKEGAGFKLFLWKLGRKENKVIWKKLSTDLHLR